MNGRYQGKRFAGFLLTLLALFVGLLVGDPSIYASFSVAVGLAYAAYLGGQSATDWHKAKHNGENK